MSHKSTSSFPSKEQLLEYLESQPHPVSRRDIARAFQIKGAERIPMKALLKDLIAEGHLERYGGSYRKIEKAQMVLAEILEMDETGEYVAYPVEWHDTDKPRIYIFAPRGRRGKHLLSYKIGDRVLVKLFKIDKHAFEGKVIRKVEKQVLQQIIGRFTASAYGGWIEPTDRKLPDRISIHQEATGGAETGDLVLIEVPPRQRMGSLHGEVKEILGSADDPRMFSLIAQYQYSLPHIFSEDAQKIANSAKLPSLKGREDLREIPLVTIDGEDARDFDDAVWAAPDPEHEGGWQVIVAIADVAYYVRPFDALDNEARVRGNSVYFPDRVIPMLPEALSNEMCSLKPNVERACLAAKMRIDKNGRLRQTTFVRGIMKSVARLTYTQVQNAIDRKSTDLSEEFIQTILHPLYGVFKVLKKARAARQTIDLDIPEQRVVFDAQGHIEKVIERERFDSHRLIEELMIAANVAAATVLEDKNLPCMYRVHDRPDPAKLSAVVQVIHGLGYKKSSTIDVSHASINKILEKAKGHEDEDLVNMLILRAMAQACYSPDNVGHYGLNLKKYCHFTSPIRRYSDVLVHRALITAFKLGEGGFEPVNMTEVGRQISETERTAAAAERDTLDRFMAAYMARQEMRTFKGHIVSVTKFGLFIKLEPIGATGFLPLRSLTDDYYIYQESQNQLIGRRRKTQYRLGQSITVNIVQVTPLTGSIELGMSQTKAKKPQPFKKKQTSQA